MQHFAHHVWNRLYPKAQTKYLLTLNILKISHTNAIAMVPER